MVTPLSHAELSQRLLEQLNEAEKPLLNGFLAHVLPEMTVFQNLNGNPACWCDPAGFLEILRFLITPHAPFGDGIQVRVIRQQGEAGAGIPEGTRLMVNLPDTPFVLDAVRSFLKQSGWAIYALAHTVLHTRRNDQQQLMDFVKEAGQREMVLVALIETLADDRHLGEVEATLRTVLTAVRHSVEDFPLMRHYLEEEAAALTLLGHDEESRFLRWLLEDNFVFMGMRTLQEEQGVRLGLFNNSNGDGSLHQLVPGLMEEVEEILSSSGGEVLTIDYCRHGRSIIYASEGVDFFAVRRPAGHLLLVFGRFSRTALANRASSVPILAGQAREILALSGFERDSSAYYEFRSLFDRMPLRELFYSQPVVVARQIREILRLQGDTDVRVMARSGRHGHYGAILCAFFHNRYRPGLEEEVARAVAGQLQRQVAAVTMAGTNTRVFVVCYVDHDPATPFQVDIATLAQAVKNLILTWMDRLREALILRMSPPAAQRLLARHPAFADASYQGATTPQEAALDLTVMEEVGKGKTFACRLTSLPEGRYHLRLYGRRPHPLPTMLRVLDHLAIVCHHEFSCSLPLGNDGQVYISRYEVELPEEMAHLAHGEKILQHTLAAIEAGVLADDPLNRLALLVGLEPRQLAILVALRQYLLQLYPQLAASAINRAMLGTSKLARLLVEGFARQLSHGSTAKPWQPEFEQELSQVTLLADDQIWHALQNLVTACLRTNAFVDPMADAMAIKIDPAKMANLAPPRPWREIFVYAPGLEGVHLRGGAVARGGIRHSDRLDDYRREVLGLMQTQRVKNAIIVPEGAKGGFVLTQWEQIPPAQRAGDTVRRYQQYIRALLSITDNVVQNQVIPPHQVVTLDGPDPYLVVAADKGTASFSDVANRLAAENHFWLGDAFASGGSHGYNHKAMGITARGAWQCIRLHFQEMGHDLEKEGIIVVAIGDMAGDVFGNGMLVTPALRLVAAFNHQHIFLDPDPNPQASFQERQRLFHLPTSTWMDYRPEVISAGGGVFLRSAKAIPLSDSMGKRLAVEEKTLSGEELIRRLLTAPVDLLYNGGIGTYIKSHGESHATVGDKANDAVRVDAHQVQAKVIAEGGNLGITRQGRLELARSRPPLPAVRMNTDGVDNSGGVDLSDHEVNLKIFLDLLIQRRCLSLAERDSLLASLADEVATAVLADNHAQHLAISRDHTLSQCQPDLYLEIMDYLVEHAGLDPQVEAIPEGEGLATEEGMPRPLLAILLGYAKIHIKRVLLSSPLLDLPYCSSFLRGYFPSSLMDRFAHQVEGHFLRREIIAATISNHVINQSGVGLFFAALLRNRQEGISLPQQIPTLVQGWLVADFLLDGSAFRHLPLWRAGQNRLEEVVVHMALGVCRQKWLTLEESRLAIWRQMIHQLMHPLWEMLPQLLGGEKMAALSSEHNRWLAKGVSAELASRICLLPLQKELPDLLSLSQEKNQPLLRLVALHLQLGDHFGLDWLEERLPKVRNRDLWGQLTVTQTRRQLHQCRLALVAAVASASPQSTPSQACATFINGLAGENSTYLSLLAQAKRQEQIDLLPLTVLVSRVREFV